MPAKPYRGGLESITPKATGATPPPASNLDVFTGQPISIKSMSPVDRTLSRAFVEAHTHAGARVDLTPWTKRATWTPRVKQPWTDINVTLALPWANRSLVPQNGDVLVVRDERGFPQAWGYVITEPSPGIEGGLANAGSRSSAPIQVRAVSWLQYLASVQLFASPYALAGRTESLGTLFTAQDWTDRVYALMGSLTNGNLGQALVTAVNAMCRIELPPTLGGGSLADAITVVYDNASASQARLSDLWCDPVKGPRIMGTGGYFPESTNVLDFLRGIFVPDPRLVEFWETLAPLAQESQAARDKLGANPVLVYRIAPFRTQSLASFLSETSATQQSGAAQPTQTLATGGTDAPVVVADPDRALLAAYEAPSWQPSRGSFVSIDRDFVQFPSPQRTDAERVNLVTIGLPTMPDAPIRFWPEAGLPYVDEASVRRYGVRLYQPNWPFFAPTTTVPTANTALGTVAQQGATAGALGANSGGTGNGETLVGYMRAVAGLAAMMFLGMERFYSGRFTLGTLTGKVDIGRPVTLAFPGGGTFGAYVDAVTHEASFDGPQGQCQGSSAVQYSRGVYNPPTVREGPERQAVQVETVKPVAKKKPAATARSTTPVGTRVRKTGILFNGNEIPWVSPFPLDWWLLTKDLSTRQKRATTAAITQAIMHYTDGNVNSLTISGARAHFNSNRETADQVDSHFGIEANGTVVQLMDMALVAFQAGVSAVNKLSVGIDFVCPMLKDRPVQDTSLPWQYKTGFDVQGGRDTSAWHIYTPSTAQIASARALLFWLSNNTGMPLEAPAASTNPNLIVRAVYDTAPPPGVYHHAEIISGRADCLGVYIPTDLL